jgi:hypothetical protein
MIVAEPLLLPQIVGVVITWALIESGCMIGTVATPVHPLPSVTVIV